MATTRYVLPMAERRDVSELRGLVDRRLTEAGFTKDRGSRNNEVILSSWRRIVGGRLSTLELNDWDPWGEGRLVASRVDVEQAEGWWASRVPMTASEMTLGDVELAIEKGVQGEIREVELTPQADAWADRALRLIDWVEAGL